MLCTTDAIGILFWALAEPTYHVCSPPSSSGLEPNSPGAKTFAMSTLYLHRAYTPYAICTLPAIAFSLAHCNLGKSYSLGGMPSVTFGKRTEGKGGQLIDALALRALVAGMSVRLSRGARQLPPGTGAPDRARRLGTARA